MVDPDTKNIIVITDEETSRSIGQVITNLDHPKAQVLIKVVFLEVQHNNSTDIGFEGTFGNRFGNSLTSSVANVFGANGLNTITTNFNFSGPATAIPALTQASLVVVLQQAPGTNFQATLRAIA